MGKVIISNGSGGGVTSDDVTITKAMLPQGYTAVTRDSDDEVVSGENPVIGVQNIVLPINGSSIINKGVHNGQGKVTQSIPALGGQTITPSSAQQVVSSSGKYMTGNITVNSVSNLLAQYIKKGVWVGGVLGTFSGFVPDVGDLYLNGSINTAIVSGFSYFTDGWVGGLSFRSNEMILSKGSNNNIFLISNNSINLSGITRVTVEGTIVTSERFSFSVYPSFRTGYGADVKDYMYNSVERNGSNTMVFDVSNVPNGHFVLRTTYRTSYNQDAIIRKITIS